MRAVTETYTSHVDIAKLLLEPDDSESVEGWGEWKRGKDRQLVSFRPARLDIEWRNGHLYQCTLRGPRLSPDGTESRTGEWARISYIETLVGGTGLGRILCDDTPHWVTELVDDTAITVTLAPKAAAPAHTGCASDA